MSKLICYSIITLTLSTLFISCGDPVLLMASDTSYIDQDIDYEPATLEEAWRFVADSITYEADPEGGYKKLPEETYKDKTGDCEDTALLLAYFATRLGYDVDIVLGYTTVKPNELHCAVRIDGRILESGAYRMVWHTFTVTRSMSYQVAFYTNTIK